MAYQAYTFCNFYKGFLKTSVILDACDSSSIAWIKFIKLNLVIFVFVFQGRVYMCGSSVALYMADCLLPYVSGGYRDCIPCLVCFLYQITC